MKKDYLNILEDIPHELLWEICRHCSVTDLLALLQTSKTVNAICKSNLVWAERYNSYYFLYYHEEEIQFQLAKSYGEFWYKSFKRLYVDEFAKIYPKQREFYESIREDNYKRFCNYIDGYPGESINLLVNGEPLSAKFKKKSPILIAVETARIEIFNVLINHGADVNVTDNKGRGILHYAALYGRVEIIKEISNLNLDFNLRDEYSRRTPLHLAVKSGHLEVVIELLKNGANVDSETNYYRLTPLCIAASNGPIEIVKELLNNGANVNHESNPILAACFKDSNLEVVIELLNNGANLNVKDSRGYTPLMIAAERGNHNIVKKLLKNGVDLHNISYSQKLSKPIHLAAYEGHIEVIKEILNNGVDIDLTDSYGRTALCCAAQSQQLDLVKFLLANGASVNSASKHGISPLMNLCYGNNKQMERLKIIRNLIENGVDINKKDYHGETALRRATGAYNYNEQIIITLLENGASDYYNSSDSISALFKIILLYIFLQLNIISYSEKNERYAMCNIL